MWRAIRSFLSCIEWCYLVIYSEAKILCQSLYHHDVVCVCIAYFGFRVLNKKNSVRVGFFCKAIISIGYSVAIEYFKGRQTGPYESGRISV